MTEPDPFAEFADIPQDVVPRRMPSRLDLTPGAEVVVTWPGRVLTDDDGIPCAVEASTSYPMTVTSSGALVGWINPATEDTP